MQESSKGNAPILFTALAIQCDVTDSISVESAIHQALDHFKTLDGLIANAGFGVAGKVESLSVEDYRRQFETNFFSVIHCFHQIKNALIASRGFFTVIGSVNSYLSLPTASAYAMSKYAIRAFCEALYWEMKPKGVSITLICPGFIDTEIRKVNNRGEFKAKSKDPVPRWLMMSADQAAHQIYQATLKREKEKVITVHGKILVGLARFIPWSLNPLMNSLIRGREQWNDHKD